MHLAHQTPDRSGPTIMIRHYNDWFTSLRCPTIHYGIFALVRIDPIFPLTRKVPFPLPHLQLHIPTQLTRIQ